MTTYSISTDAQPIFPDGYNDAMTLFNQGPWTIFLDDNSSIGSQSYALKPSMTMVWPANRALWAKGNTYPSGLRPTAAGQPFNFSLTYQNSTLVATRGNFAASSQFASKALFTIRQSRYTANDGYLFSTDYPFEADSYNSLVVTMKDLPWKATGDSVSTTVSHMLNFLWYDDLGNLITTDRFVMPYMGYSNNDSTLLPQRVVTPVQGKYCLVTHESGDFTQPVAGPMNWIVQGSTESIAPRADYWVYQNSIDNSGSVDNTRWSYSPIWNRNQNNGGAFISGVVLGSDSAYVNLWQAGQPLFLNGVSRQLSLSLRTAGAAAGNVLVHTFDPAGFASILASIAIAAGTASYNAIIPVPISSPVRITNSATNISASLIWY